MNHLYISDLDGTLLRSDVSISDWSRDQLYRLLSEQFPFTIATARSVGSVQEILKGIPFHLPIVGGNGAYVSDFHSGDHIRINHLDLMLIDPLLGMIRNQGHLPFISTFDGYKDALYYERVSNQGGEWFITDRIKARDKRLRHTPHLKNCFRESVISFTVVDREEALMELKYMLHDAFPQMLEIHIYDNYHTPEWFWMSIHDRQATKANGILSIAEELGFKREDITVFGDNTNDVSMFQVAGRSVAVENAKDEVKAFATHTIGHHESDSVIRFIIAEIETLTI